MLGKWRHTHLVHSRFHFGSVLNRLHNFPSWWRHRCTYHHTLGRFWDRDIDLFDNPDRIDKDYHTYHNGAGLLANRHRLVCNPVGVVSVGYKLDRCIVPGDIFGCPCKHYRTDHNGQDLFSDLYMFHHTYWFQKDRYRAHLRTTNHPYRCSHTSHSFWDRFGAVRMFLHTWKVVSLDKMYTPSLQICPFSQGTSGHLSGPEHENSSEKTRDNKIVDLSILHLILSKIFF